MPASSGHRFWRTLPLGARGKIIGTKHVTAALAGVLTLAAGALDAQTGHLVSVREVMEAVVAPSTDVLWAAEMPMSEAAWRDVDAAAVAIIAAGTLINSGGSGPTDADWAAQDAWRAFTDTMIAAALVARQAVENEDFDALMTAGEQIYPPCEGCHLAFHPEVRQAQ